MLSKPIGRGHCTRQQSFVLSQSLTLTRLSNRKRLLKSSLDARSRSQDKITIRGFAKMVWITVPPSKASLSCGDATVKCWVKRKFLMDRIENSTPFNSTLLFWTLAFKPLELV